MLRRLLRGGLRRGALVVTLALSCLYPTDESGQLRVELLSGVSQLFVGDTMRVTARVVDQRGAVVANAAVGFRSSDNGVLVIDAQGRAFGVAGGRVDVEVRALQYDHAASVTLPVRVFRGIEIFGVTAEHTPPDAGAVAHYGERIRVVGIGLDPASLPLLLIGSAAPHVVRFAPAVVTDPDSRDTLELVVPAGIPSAVDVVALGSSGTTAVWPLRVIRSDLFEPNDNPPPSDLGTVTQAIDLFDLALELPEDVDPNGYLYPRAFDLYRMRMDPTTRELSIVFATPRAPKTPNELPFRVFITESVQDVRTEGFPYDAIIPVHDFYQSAVLCRGELADLYHYAPGLDGPNSRGHRDSVIVALKDLPPGGVEPGALDITVSYSLVPSEPVPYDIRLVPEYLSVLPPDQGEENDFCGMAYPLPMDGVPLTFNFDQASDVDWFRFTVGGDPPSTAPTTNDVAESEPNDPPATVDTVALGDRVTGVISPGGDRDGFRFYAAAGTLLDFDVTAYDAGSDLDAVLQLFDSAGTEIAFNDDYGPTLDSRLIFLVPTSGWYVVTIQDFGMWCCGDPHVGGPDAPNGFYEIALSQFASGSIVTMTLTSTTPWEGVLQVFEPPEEGWRQVAFVCCAFDQGAGWMEQWQQLINPGEYYVMLHDPPGNPVTYTVTGSLYTIGGGASPPADLAGLSAPVPASYRAGYRVAKERRLTRLAGQGATRGEARP